MIERALAIEIGGAADIAYHAAGIHFTAVAPLHGVSLDG